MSGFDSIQTKNPGVRLVHRAMEECLDARSVCNFQKSKLLDGTGANLLHRQWHEQTGNSAVASIPLFSDDKCVAIVSIRNRVSKPFDADDIKKVTQVVEPFLPGLWLLKRANRGVLQTIKDRLSELAATTFAQDRPTRALVAAVVVGVMSWLLVASTPFRFTVPCELVPTSVQHFSAPLNAAILASDLKQGDSVQAGQILLEFDTRDLLAERNKITSELEIAKSDLNSALLRKDDAAAAKAGSEVRIAESKLKLMDGNLARSVIRAPFDGVVLSGDPRNRVGQVVPVGDPLFSLGPAKGLRLQLELPQNCVQYAEVGQSGYFVTKARTDEKHAFQIDRVPLSSTAYDGKSVYLSEASLNEHPDWLRVGMTGFAKVTGQRKPIWWITTRKFIDSLRLRVWRL